MMPMLTAQGQISEPCPKCGVQGTLTGILKYTHVYRCDNPACEYEGYGIDHSGGTATCTQKAKCAVCGAEYGKLADHS